MENDFGGIKIDSVSEHRFYLKNAYIVNIAIWTAEQF